jgi:hypothetical protein
VDRFPDLTLNLVLSHWVRLARARGEILVWQSLARGAEIVLIVKPYVWIGTVVFIVMFVLGYVAAMTGF